MYKKTLVIAEKKLKPPPPRAKDIKIRLTAIEAIVANFAPLTNSEHSRLTGVEQTLRYALGKDNHLDRWIDDWARTIVGRHAEARDNCQCGVCRFLMKPK